MSGRFSTQGCSIVWFRDDLRIGDNPALTTAIDRDLPVVGLFILDEASDGLRPIGAASRWWLNKSIARLSQELIRLNVSLILRRGRADAVVNDIVVAAGADAVFWNRRYGPAERAVDASLKESLTAAGIHVESHAASLLFEPWTLKPATAPYYRVFTPFWRAALGSAPPRRPLPVPKPAAESAPRLSGDRLADWRLHPTSPDWSGGLEATWTPGEAGARARLDAFLSGGIDGYAAERDRPALAATSRLSPHLRFGEISPHQVWHAAEGHAPGGDGDKFLSEIGWREFCWHLHYHVPDLAGRAFNPRFDAFPWRSDPAALTAWQRGETGYPIIDAGMRELWHTGWMHNRVRMLTASFLTKTLMIDWRLGEAWFWDTLVDADPANNPAGWQWVAGCGADAAPYFRIFNPVLQAEKFDPDGAYIRRWVPALRGAPGKTVHRPQALSSAGLLDAETGYGPPIVDLQVARQRALAAFKTL